MFVLHMSLSSIKMVALCTTPVRMGEPKAVEQNLTVVFLSISNTKYSDASKLIFEEPHGH